MNAASHRPPLRGAARWCAVAAGCALALVTLVTTAAARTSRHHVIVTRATLPLRTGLLDTIFEQPQTTALAMVRAAGISYLRLGVSWRDIAPATRSSGFVATDPKSRGYYWAGIDAIVKQAVTAGLTPILDIATPPTWAYAVQPSGVNAGTPSIADLGDFATAIATHYDGRTAGVPAEHVFQVWNEPNNSLDLSPVKGSTYREMVNAFAQAAHAVAPADVVVAGALDPFGHPKGKKQKWYSVPPLAFMRSVLCVSKGKHPHATCHSAAHFDAWSHHPYTFGGPFGRAKRTDAVEIGDLPKMHALLKAGVRFHHLVSSRPVQFWVTEIGWDTNPPRPHAPSLSLGARWTAESLHQMWRSGVSLVTWFLLQDYPSPSPYQSGLYFYSKTPENARPKPVLTAFRFPFVAYRGKKTVSVWGRDATSDEEVVTVQRRHGKSGRWRTVALIRSNQFGIFKASLRLKSSKKDWLRATAASGKSLAFSLTVPHAPNVGPWGN